MSSDPADILGAWAARGDGSLVLGVRCFTCDLIRMLPVGLAWAFRARRDVAGRCTAFEAKLLAEARQDPRFVTCGHIHSVVKFDRVAVAGGLDSSSTSAITDTLGQ